jgi:hypothetical protein
MQASLSSTYASSAATLVPARFAVTNLVGAVRDAPTSAAPLGCSAHSAAATCEAAARHLLQRVAAPHPVAQRPAPTDTPTELTTLSALARQGHLTIATPASVKPGADGIADDRPNERFISVKGTVNGQADTLITAVAERDGADAPWRTTYTIGFGPQLRIEQQPLEGKPGRYQTTIGPLYPDLDLGNFGPAVTLLDTGALQVRVVDGRVSATIDGRTPDSFSQNAAR